MKKWTTVDRAPGPDGKTISLHEHDGSYSIRVDAAELMSTRQHGSEEKLSQLACVALRETTNARVLIGGLGFGFTLKAALAVLAPDASVVVAEIMPSVVMWNRNESLPLAAKALEDPRVRVLHGDVREAIRQPGIRFDAIILDVDNGPAALTSPGNSNLYDDAGLKEAYGALRAGGRLAVWSASANPAFEKRMGRAGFRVEVRRVRAREGGGAWHTIFVGRV